MSSRWKLRHNNEDFDIMNNGNWFSEAGHRWDTGTGNVGWEYAKK